VKLLLVGESNPYSARADLALYPLPAGASGSRLCKILGLTPARYLEEYDRVNLVPDAKDWTTSLARALAECLTHPYRVLLGSRVCAAHGVPFLPFTLGAAHGTSCTKWPFVEERGRRGVVVIGRPAPHGAFALPCAPGTGCFWYAVLPHPSGRSRVWNDSSSERRARAVVRRLRRWARLA